MLKVGFSESTMFRVVRPLWGLKIRANEGRGQTCLDYAKCSRIWRNSKKTLRVFYGGLNNDGRAAHARIIFNFKFFISNYNMYLCSRFFAKGISCFAVESIILNLTRMP